MCLGNEHGPLTLTTFLNLPSAIQPALTIRINSMLSQQSVIHAYKYSFPIPIVWDWNNLPGSIVEAGSLSRFKSALKRFLNIY